MDSIWKDYFVDFGDTDSVNFEVSFAATGVAIYTGKAYRKPGAATCEIRINDICADYLGIPCPLTGETSEHGIAVSFDITNLDTGMIIDTVEFLPDWSYDYGYELASGIITFPIVKTVDPRAPFVYSSLEPNNPFSVGLTLEDGTTQTENLNANSDGVVMFDIMDYTAELAKKVVRILIDGHYYDVDWSLCHNYALYYRNAFGGWDTLLVQGFARKTDGYTRHSQGQTYDNRQSTGRGRRDYAIEVQRSFELLTGWLDEAQAALMHHVLGSTSVYLYDLIGGRAFPVVLTNADCPYKTYDRDGMIDYTINAQIAQEMVRK